MLWKLQDALNPETQTMDYATWKKAGEGIEGILNFMCEPLIPATEKTSYRTLRCQSGKDLTVLACALERYYLKEGAYPETLEMLIPEYLPQMPPGSGPPALLSYELNEKGYELRANRLPEQSDNSLTEAVWKRVRE